jgi:hypothetical protein
MRRALFASLLALTACPATAAAQEPPADPQTLLTTPTAERAPVKVARGGDLDFVIRSATDPGSIKIRISGTAKIDAAGMLTGPKGTYIDNPTSTTADLHEWRANARFLARHRPGTYWWQPILAVPGQAPVVGQAETFEVIQPAANRRKRKLFPRKGRRGHGSFYLSNVGFPAGVTAERFEALSHSGARRWGLRARRWTAAVAGPRDGYNVAGFNPSVPSFALAVQIDYVVGPSRTIVERDLALRPNINWQAGPGYPAFDQFDLESVLVHELSHFAGNKRHTKRCVNSPLIVGLASGEWWRGPRDSWVFGCKASAATTASPFAPASAKRGVVIHKTVRVG